MVVVATENKDKGKVGKGTHQTMYNKENPRYGSGTVLYIYVGKDFRGRI